MCGLNIESQQQDSTSYNIRRGVLTERLSASSNRFSMAKITRAAVVLAVMYITATVFNALLSIAVVAAASVLGIMCVQVFKSIGTVAPAQQSGDQQGQSTPVTMENVENDRSEERTSSQQQINNIPSSQNQRWISSLVIYVISRTIVFGLAPYLNINMAATLVFIAGGTLCIMSPDNTICQKVSKATDTMGECISDIANDTFMRKPSEFIAEKFQKVFGVLQERI